MPSHHAFPAGSKSRFAVGASVFCVAVGLAPQAARAQAPAVATEFVSPVRANADPNGERELRAILDELSAAVLQHNGRIVEKYYSADYVMTFSSGTRGDFENSLRVLTDTNRNEWHRHELSNERFVFFGPTAIATFTVHSQWTARASRKEFDVREHVTQTWVRRDGRWSVVATHVTAIDPGQK